MHIPGKLLKALLFRSVVFTVDLWMSVIENEKRRVR